MSDYWSSLASSLCWTEPNTGCATDCLVADKDEAAVSFPPLHAAERWEYTNYLLSGAQVQVHHLGTDIYMIIIFSSYSFFFLIRILEWFLKDHVTVKTGVMMLKIQLYHHRKLHFNILYIKKWILIILLYCILRKNPWEIIVNKTCIFILYKLYIVVFQHICQLF